MGSKHSSNPPPPPEPGETCKTYVARVCGTDYYLINPWVDNIAGWTEAMCSTSPFPREGANDPFHMDMVKGLCLGDRAAWPYYDPDPGWDKKYMEQGGMNWLEFAPYWRDTEKNIPRKLKIRSDKEKSDKLHSLEKTLPKISINRKHKPPPPYNQVYPNLGEFEDVVAISALIPEVETADDPQGIYPMSQVQVPHINQSQPTAPTLTPRREFDRSVMTLQPRNLQTIFEERGSPDSTMSTIVHEEVRAPLNTTDLGLSPQLLRSGNPHNLPVVKQRRSRAQPTAGTHFDPTSPDVEHFPFMTVGNYLIKRVIDIEDINKIVKHCPKPSVAPEGTIAYLKKACDNRNFTQEDLKLILDQVIGPHTDWDWNNVKTISEIQQVTVAGPPQTHRVPHSQEYNLNTVAGRTAMWNEVTTEMRRVFKQRANLSNVLVCKQKATENVTEFYKRFHKAWVEDSGISTLNNDQLFISTFLNNVLPHMNTPIKQLISTWPTETIKGFETKLQNLEAAGCFDIKKPAATTSTTHHFTDRAGNFRGRGRGRGNFNQSRDRQVPRFPPGTCYNCGDPNHWARDCPRPRKPYHQPCQTPQNEQKKGPEGTKFPINWTNQQTSQ